MRRKILILGGGGFIGTHLHQKLKSEGYQVQITVRSNQCKDIEPINTIIGDIDTGLLDSCDEPDYIFHLAGGSSVLESQTSPHSDFLKTLPNISSLMNKMYRDWKSSKLLFISSAAVYGKYATAKTSTKCQLSPISVYGLHKKIAEEIILYYVKTFGVRAKIIRPFSIFGEGLKKQLPWDVLIKARNGDFTFFGSGEQQRDWVYIEDFIQFLTQQIDANIPYTGEIVNAGNGQAVKISHVISRLLCLSGYTDPPIFSGKDKIGDPDCLVADPHEQAQNTFLSLRKTPLDTGLSRYISWFNESQI
ncbi:NAD-dependent epimerase/dehydratase family protein [Bowmanella yangjiangensis]|uniref:NAD-dependent epimerase/dehydratase family protein n=1 Tax=Bowmanella yangjiangensis TaxID=2811230 RepID=A0ABS3CP57_9ALTE|nr:NAD-dependent epimerase/dehydratase family protein [Bowmanella yangjiangensis]MBN7818870.1 NAD-dependent epimerase/dehydratase family protein [Bowmanella yangjiangensis]